MKSKPKSNGKAPRKELGRVRRDRAAARNNKRAQP